MSLEHDVDLPSPQQRKKNGRACREATPRASLAYVPDRRAGFDAVAVLENQGTDRLTPYLAIRYHRMSESPFAFFRGAAAIQALDLAAGSSTGIEVQLCGDAHLLNFGIFSSPERRLIFDINDFDETSVGPFEWDLKRLGASIAIAAAHLNFTPRQQVKAVIEAVSEYRRTIRMFANTGVMSTWYSSLDLESLIISLRQEFTDEAMRQVDNILNRARTRTSVRAFEKLVNIEGDRPRITSDPPLIVPVDQISGLEGIESISRLLDYVIRNYAPSLSSEHQVLLSQFTPIDAALKVVGVGSVGTRCYVMLLLGRDTNDPLFLQIKEAGSSVIDDALGRVAHYSGGERVVHGQRLMQAASDLFLGWHPMTGADGSERSFYVRQLYDNKASVNVDRLVPATMAAYARVCGWTLARAHACSGKAIEIAGYIGKSKIFEDSIASYSVAYRHRNAIDHHSLMAAIDSGRIIASHPDTVSEIPDDVAPVSAESVAEDERAWPITT